jgi:hypothetical protein
VTGLPHSTFPEAKGRRPLDLLPQSPARPLLSSVDFVQCCRVEMIFDGGSGLQGQQAVEDEVPAQICTSAGNL